MTNLTKGILIAFEGIDGAGKTTQAISLVNSLREQGYDAIYLKEPTDGQYGKQIRDMATHGRHDPKQETELFLQDRMEDVQNNISPALDAGKVVIMDRYYISNICYQGALGESIPAIKKANEKFAPVPELVILLDISPRVGISRITKFRGDKTNHFEKESYLRKVKRLFDKLDESYIQRIDAVDPPADVRDAVMNAVYPLLRRYSTDDRKSIRESLSVICKASG